MVIVSAVQMFASGVGAASSIVLSSQLAAGVLAFLAGRRSERVAPVVTAAATVAAAGFGVYAVSAVVFGHDTRMFLAGKVEWAGGTLGIVLAITTPWLFGRYQTWHSRLSRGAWEAGTITNPPTAVCAGAGVCPRSPDRISRIRPDRAHAECV